MSDAISSRDWSAAHNHMPPGPRIQRVRGTIEYPTPGYEAWLEAAEPQGTNTRVLELELRETAPTGPQPEVVTPVEVEYEDQTDSEYDEVHVRPLGEVIPVEHPE